jgi:hypothetical protein
MRNMKGVEECGWYVNEELVAASKMLTTSGHEDVGPTRQQRCDACTSTRTSLALCATLTPPPHLV